MMEAEIGAVTTALLGGLVVGGGLSLWRSAREQDEKCEFLRDVRGDLSAAFVGADELLGDARTPVPLRVVLLVMLHGFADEDIGLRLAKAMFLDEQDSDKRVEENPVSVAMRGLADVAPALERTAHRTLVALSMGLLVVHFGDGLKATRVQRDLANDPASVWSKIGETVDSVGHGNGNHIAHA